MPVSMDVTEKIIAFAACMFTVISNGCYGITGHKFACDNSSLMMSSLALSPLIMRYLVKCKGHVGFSVLMLTKKEFVVHSNVSNSKKSYLSHIPKCWRLHGRLFAEVHNF